MIRWGRIFNRYRRALLPVAGIFLILVACAGPQTPRSASTGVYHVVKKGETAYSIARAYSTSIEILAQANDIRDISHLKEGQVIFIPDAAEVIDDVMVQARQTGDLDEKPVPKVTAPPAAPSATLPQKKPPVTAAPPAAPKQPPAPVTAPKEPPEKTAPPARDVPGKDDDIVVAEKGKLVWPVRGKVKTSFGVQPNKTFHNWIRISCAEGEAVRSAAAGTVIYSSTLAAYGETIIIRHSNGFATVYTHLKKREVQRDQAVKKGQVIARAGETDETGACFIHFEIRHRSKPQNPLIYLP
jgi:lipoprotein NlpD